jgi:predicted Rossmann fold nucleotide-binding protein DprA/Smf involved in DNA uptake
MAKETREPTAAKDEMKKLRKRRKYIIAAVTERLKQQRKAVQALEAELRQASKTVPELAQATRLPTSQVLYYIATLRKYGKVVEGEAAGGYFKYRLAEDKAASESGAVETPAAGA